MRRGGAIQRKVYNSVVDPLISPTSKIDDRRKHRHAVYAAESTGLLILAVLLLVFTIIHYWRDIPWAAR